MGRFLTRDTWGGDANRPLSLNRWGYVEGNPVLYTDHSGKFIDCQDSRNEYEDEICMWPPSTDPRAENPTIEPSGIIWSPSVTAHPLIIKDKNDNIIPPGTRFSQGFITDPDGKYISGACGPLSIAAIANWWDPNGLFLRSYDLYWHWDNGKGQKYPVRVTPNYTGTDEVEAIIRSLPIWDAYTVNSISDDKAYLSLRNALSKHHFPIPGVNISGGTGIVGHGTAGHWLVVTGLSIDYQWSQGYRWQWVRVFNPFNNQNEFYMWSWFKKSWGGANWGNRQMVVMCSRIPVSGISDTSCK